ncbi:MAG: metal-dependent hydrolase [Limnohabitans sp.]
MTTLTVRRLGVDLSKGFARHWNGGDAFLTAFCNALSMSFPVGEQFFIDAVREGARQLGDSPAHQTLRETARGFIGQEATHRHLHGIYNAHLEKQGFINHWGPRAARRLQAARLKMFSTSDKGYLHELAITAAYEHFTAIFGDLTLESADRPGDWFAQAQEPLQTLWRWHAAEESEHKSLAFDLYTALGGNHAWRMRWFNYVLLQFMLDALRQTLNNLWHDRSLHKLSTWRSGMRFLFGRHGLVRRVWAPVKAYRRADFHPTQVGDSTLARHWLSRNAARWTPVGAPTA